MANATPNAERILARTWTQIIWRCWQDNQPYDPTRHAPYKPSETPRLDIGRLRSDAPD